MELLQAVSRKLVISDMTPEAVISIIESVDRDPLAGLGKYSKREILADRIAAQWKICAAQLKGIPARDPKAVITEAKS